MSEKIFVLNGFNSFSDIEGKLRKVYIEGKRIEKIQVNQKNFDKLNEISKSIFRLDLEKEMKISTIFGKLLVIIKEEVK